MANVIFKVGTKALYDALEQKDSNTLYWLTDTREVYKGEDLFAVGLEATQTQAGLMSAVDKQKLDGLDISAVSGLTPVDATIVLEDAENGGKTIQVGISAELGNLLSIREDGLFVSAGELSDGIDAAQEIIDSLPDEILSEIASVSRTENTNVAQIRISIKQADGTYSTSQEHGILTLIPAGYGADGISGAGLMSLSDKEKLDSIDTDAISSLTESLVWGSL